MWSGSPLHRVLKSLHATAFSQSERFHQFRRHMAEIAVATVIVIAVGTLLVFHFERHASGTAITNVGDSLFWTTAQVLTVSSQMPNPQTTGGRIVDVFLMAYAVVFIGLLVNVFGKVLLRDDEEEESEIRRR
jgi:voltage-gated potassium channel